MLVAYSNRFQMTYTKRETPILVPLEYKMMEELGVDRSELHKLCFKEFYNRRQSNSLKLI
jgi:hypothetical protein